MRSWLSPLRKFFSSTAIPVGTMSRKPARIIGRRSNASRDDVRKRKPQSISPQSSIRNRKPACPLKNIRLCLYPSTRGYSPNASLCGGSVSSVLGKQITLVLVVLGVKCGTTRLAYFIGFRLLFGKEKKSLAYVIGIMNANKQTRR